MTPGRPGGISKGPVMNSLGTFALVGLILAGLTLASPMLVHFGGM